MQLGTSKGMSEEDIRGRLLTTQNNINASQTSIQVDVPTQVLLLQITSLDGVVVTKKVIK